MKKFLIGLLMATSFSSFSSDYQKHDPADGISQKAKTSWTLLEIGVCYHLSLLNKTDIQDCRVYISGAKKKKYSSDDVLKTIEKFARFRIQVSSEEPLSSEEVLLQTQELIESSGIINIIEEEYRD